MLDGERLTFGFITPVLIYTAAFCGLGGPHLTVLAHGPSFSSRGGTMSMSIIFLDVKGRGARYITALTGIEPRIERIANATQVGATSLFL
jgi:hypothetical protein